MRTPIRRSLALIAGALAAAGPLGAAELTGSVALRGPALGPEEASSAVVWFVPDAAHRPASPLTLDIRTRGKTFVPSVAVVPVGSTVRFPNDDPLLHNVFSVSPGNAFDVGLYGPGAGESRTFREAGVVRLFCNVHHTMAAHVVVLDTPYFTRPDASGSFVLRGLPTGTGRLHVFHERSPEWSGPLSVPSGEPVRVELELARRRVPRHLDKRGRPYDSAERERYD